MEKLFNDKEHLIIFKEEWTFHKLKSQEFTYKFVNIKINLINFVNKKLRHKLEFEIYGSIVLRLFYSTNLTIFVQLILIKWSQKFVVNLSIIALSFINFSDYIPLFLLKDVSTCNRCKGLC